MNDYGRRHKAQTTASCHASLRALIPILVVIASMFTVVSGVCAEKGYVGLFKDNAVAVFDMATNKTLSTIPVPSGPEGVALTPDGRKLYAASSGASTVSVIDTATDKVTAYIEVGEDPQGLMVTPNGKRVLVCVSGTDEVVKIDIATDRVVARAKIPKAHNLAISPDGLTAYVGSQQPDSPALVILNVDRMAQTGKIALDKVPRALRFSQDGRMLYFTVAGSEAVQIADPVEKRVTGQITLGFSPHAVAFAPKDAAALVVVQGPAELDLIDPGTASVTAKVPVGKFPHWVAVTSDGRTAYVTNESSNDISIVDMVSKRVTGTFSIGNAPRKIALQRVAAVGADPSIHINNFAFSPATVTVAPGGSVTWTNDDPIPHTVTADNGKWTSGNLEQGKTYTHKFSAAGTYAYHCDIHPYMKGTVIVKK